MVDKNLKTSPLLANTTSYHVDDVNSNISQYDMLGSVYRPGLVDEMLSTNPTVQLGKLGLTAAMSQAQVSLIKCGCSDEVYEFVNEMLFKRLNTRFQQVFLKTLDALFYGIAPAEVCIDFKYGKWVITDISPRPARGFDLRHISKNNNEWWISGKYSWYDSNGGLKSVECGSPYEEDKALIWWPVFNSNGLLGQSLLRPIVNEHTEKQLIRKLRGSALNKVLFGTPVLHARKRDESEAPLDPSDVKSAQLSLARAVTGDASCLYLSSDFESPEILYAQTDGLGKANDAENALDVQILMALGSSHLARGLLSGYGSQGAGENDQLLQDSMRQYFFSWFAEAMQPLIDWIVDINFGYQDHYPELFIASPSMLSIPQLSRTLAQLVSTGLYRPCKEDEEVLRRLCRMPEQSEQFISKIDTSKSSDDGLGIKGHYDELTGLDTRIDRDVEYEERKDEM